MNQSTTLWIMMDRKSPVLIGEVQITEKVRIVLVTVEEFLF